MLKYGSQAEILRARRGNPPRTIPDYPHEQLTQGGTAALQERLRERAGALPGVVEGSNGTSAPDIRTFLLEPGYAEGPREAFLAGGEFAHGHDRASGGSLEPDAFERLLVALGLEDRSAA